MHDQTPAVLSARLDTIDEAVKQLVQIADGQSKTMHTVSTTLALLQQSSEQNFKIIGEHTIKLESLTETRNTMKGGWVALCVVGTAIVSLAGIIGALAAILAIRYHS